MTEEKHPRKGTLAENRGHKSSGQTVTLQFFLQYLGYKHRAERQLYCKNGTHRERFFRPERSAKRTSANVKYN